MSYGGCRPVFEQCIPLKSNGGELYGGIVCINIKYTGK